MKAYLRDKPTTPKDVGEAPRDESGLLVAYASNRPAKGQAYRKAWQETVASNLLEVVDGKVRPKAAQRKDKGDSSPTMVRFGKVMHLDYREKLREETQRQQGVTLAIKIAAIEPKKQYPSVYTPGMTERDISVPRISDEVGTVDTLPIIGKWRANAPAPSVLGRALRIRVHTKQVVFLSEPKLQYVRSNGTKIYEREESTEAITHYHSRTPERILEETDPRRTLHPPLNSHQRASLRKLAAQGRLVADVTSPSGFRLP